MASILVVCTGNLCRSPFAEGVLRGMLTERFGPHVVGRNDRAGRDTGDPRGDRRRIRARDRCLVACGLPGSLGSTWHADLVLAMTAEHRAVVVRLDPRAVTKTFTVKEVVRLLEDLPGPERAGGRESLATRVAGADKHRRAGFDGNPGDEDIPDPMGHPWRRTGPWRGSSPPGPSGW